MGKIHFHSYNSYKTLKQLKSQVPVPPKQTEQGKDNESDALVGQKKKIHN